MPDNDDEMLRLMEANDQLRAENAQLKGNDPRALQGHDVVPLKAGMDIHYVRGAEKRCRRAWLQSEGITDRVNVPGNQLQFALLQYADLDELRQHRFEVSRPHSALATPDTWHLIDECPLGPVQAP